MFLSTRVLLFSQVMEKLVDIVHFLHLEIKEGFGIAGMLLNACKFESLLIRKERSFDPLFMSY